MRKIFLILSALTTFTFITSCEDDTFTEILSTEDDSPNIGEGLKEALRVGTDTAVSKLNIEDGYFRDAAIKILLPDELETTLTNFKSKSIDLGLTSISGEDLYNTGYTSALLGIDIQPLKAKEDELILGLNRAAEDAATEAKPIFVDAITGMSISDANDILFGSDTAATAFLRTNTLGALFTNFEPKIENSLASVTIGEKSVTALYENFVADYNAVLNTGVGSATISSLTNINTVAATDVSEYTTNRALSGLFNKVAEEEGSIRKDPLARINDILKDVFSLLD